MHEEHNFSIHSHCSQDPSDPRVSKVPGGGTMSSRWSEPSAGHHRSPGSINTLPLLGSRATCSPKGDDVAQCPEI